MATGSVDRDALIHEGLPIVAAVARRTAQRLGGKVPVDDLISIGNFSLLEVVQTWDPSRASFAAYATRRLGWAMLDGIRRETHGRWAAARAASLIGSEQLSRAYARDQQNAPELPTTTAEEDGAALRSMLGAHAAALAVGILAAHPDIPRTATPEEEVEQAEAVHVMRAAVAGLPERERALIEGHYFRGEPFDKVARDLGITKSWASRLHQRGILALAAVMNPDGAPIDDEETVPLEPRPNRP